MKQTKAMDLRGILMAMEHLEQCAITDKNPEPHLDFTILDYLLSPDQCWWTFKLKP